ncbi:MAG TPA: hypothetical protein VK907_13165 [Phnomibacter sp.]|nr:hypothetical protein [Phnomibacter sp.]
MKKLLTLAAIAAILAISCRQQGLPLPCSGPAAAISLITFFDDNRNTASVCDPATLGNELHTPGQSAEVMVADPAFTVLTLPVRL